MMENSDGTQIENINKDRGWAAVSNPDLWRVLHNGERHSDSTASDAVWRDQIRLSGGGPVVRLGVLR